MSFANLIKSRRSTRNFIDRPVEVEKIEALTKALLYSPTGKRKNHWDFLFIEDKVMLLTLSECKPHGANLIEGAALAIVVVGDSVQSDTWIEDCSIASIILQLQAEELALGSCWVQIHKRPHNNEKTAEDFVKEQLNIPRSKNVLSLIAIGYPAKKRAPIDESELLYHKIHKGKY
ncbi:MAG: nitroreductase family protein [Prolixibacteraceae bacterium]|jgi:nitroreductase|nr:nitroreductase family protein [Prolixibacteraceae bacterium]